MTDAFPLISGHPSLDLVNTEVVRWGVRHDLLVTVDNLSDWITAMRAAGQLRAIDQPAKSSINPPVIALDPTRELRALLRKGFEELIQGKLVDSEWIRRLEEMIAKAPFAYRVVDGQLLPVPDGNAMEAFRSLIAFDALQLLVSGELSTLRHCANPDCVLLFLDASGRRKWCSMKICGNRTKVARHHAARSQS